MWNSWGPPQVVDRSKVDQATKDADSITLQMKSQMNRLNQMAGNIAKQLQKQQPGGGQGGKGGKGTRFNPYPTNQGQFPPINP